MNRREMIKNSAGLAIGASLAGIPRLSSNKNRKSKNPLPAWKGFNLVDFFNPIAPFRKSTSKDHLKWIADWGFDFVRIPMAYPYYVKFDPKKSIKPEEVYVFDEQRVENIVRLVDQANDYGLHVSLNLHRAPGFCINAGFVEPYNLWKDFEAMHAFKYHWEHWGKLFKAKNQKQISFDLLNEPCMRENMNDQFSKVEAVPVDLYRQLIINGMNAIRSSNENHKIIADGNFIGTRVISNIKDLDVSQSCRGYNPGLVSHYKAPWVFQKPDDLPDVTWPSKENGQVHDKAWLEKQFQPWIDLANSGTGVHCGECGAWRKTPHQVALAWMNDMFSVLKDNNIGWALWEFDGDFGLLNSNRKDVAYEDWYGQKLDRKMLNMLLKLMK